MSTFSDQEELEELDNNSGSEEFESTQPKDIDLESRGGNQVGSNPNNKSPKKKNDSQMKKVAKKAGKKALKEGGKLLLKVLGAVLKFIITVLGPYILIILVVVILCYCAWDIIFNNRGKSQDYQSEDTKEYNNVQYNNATGEVLSTDLSLGNKLTKAFYTYFSEKSLYVTVTDKNGNVVQKEPLQYNSPEFIKKYGEAENRTLKDKYSREKMFYVNPNALWALDEFLHKNGFRFPEQFIKPVSYDPETYDLKHLTNDDRELIAESTKYTQQTSKKPVYKQDPNDMNVMKQVYLTSDGKETFVAEGNMPKLEEGKSMMPVEGEKVKGVWDYGFGSILNYAEFEEERKAVGNFEKMNIWDVEEEKFIYNVPLDKAKEMCEKNPERYEGYDSNYTLDTEFEDKLPSSTSYMIDRVTSPAGFVTNQIVCEWQNTGKKYVKAVEIEKEVSVWREYERQVQEINPSNPEMGAQPVYKDENGNKTFTATNSPYMEKYKKKEKIKQKFRIEGEGEEYEKIPRYEGEPDLSQVTGSRYYIDYMTNYNSYVPENVMKNIGIHDFKNRTGIEQEELLKLLERHSFTGGTVGDIDLSDFEFGSGASSQNFMNAMQYFEYFQLWGETYGVDPMLLVAIASQESGGRHDSSSMGSAGFGIMQIEKPGSVITSATAYNFKTGQEETMPIPNRGAVTDVSDNIRAGAMLQAGRMKNADYNMLYGLQAYNFGSGAFNLVIKKYASDTGRTPEEVRADINDTGWIPYVLDFHKNPNAPYYLNGTWSNGVKCSIGTCDAKGGTHHYGDPGYLQNVLRYYVASEEEPFPWILREDGTKVSMDGSEFSMGTGTPSGGSNDGWLKRLWDKIFGKKNYIFPMMPPELMKESTLYEYKIQPQQAEIIYKMMFVMEERKYLSDYESFTDEDWKAKFGVWFSNPIGSKWTDSNGLIDSKGMFPEGIDKPLAFSPLTIEEMFMLPDHPGIDIVAPKGSVVYAISEGEVLSVENTGKAGKGKYVEIKHSSGAKTLYGGLSEIVVKKGDKLKRGEVIGKTGDTHDKKDVLYLELNYKGKVIDPSWLVTGNFSASDFNMTGEDAEIIAEVIRLAHTKVGCRYTQDLGYRTGPNSFDCSGFTWWLYKQVTGVEIGLNTWGQDKTLNNYRVKAEDLQPGDILMNNDLSHVVLYGGEENGKHVILHAANTRRGTVKDYYSSHPSKTYPKIYRPIAYINDKKGAGTANKPK